VSEISAPETLRWEKPRLLQQVHGAIRRLHYRRRTEEAYVHWIKPFVFWSGKRHPAKLGEAEEGAFLSQLAVELNVTAARQNQAFARLRFPYK
jgi:integrase-like protein